LNCRFVPADLTSIYVCGFNYFGLAWLLLGKQTLLIKKIVWNSIDVNTHDSRNNGWETLLKEVNENGKGRSICQVIKNKIYLNLSWEIENKYFKESLNILSVLIVLTMIWAIFSLKKQPRFSYHQNIEQINVFKSFILWLIVV